MITNEYYKRNDLETPSDCMIAGNFLYRSFERPDFHRRTIYRIKHRAITDAVAQFVGCHLLDFQYGLVLAETGPA
jgi:hypothetical protein